MCLVDFSDRDAVLAQCDSYREQAILLAERIVGDEVASREMEMEVKKLHTMAYELAYGYFIHSRENLSEEFSFIEGLSLDLPVPHYVDFITELDVQNWANDHMAKLYPNQFGSQTDEVDEYPSGLKL
ncbi:hypothetical protein ABE527_10585 [Brucella sp. TWI432]